MEKDETDLEIIKHNYVLERLDKEQTIRELNYQLCSTQAELLRLAEEKSGELSEVKVLLKKLLVERKDLHSQIKLLRHGLDSSLRAKETIEEENAKVRQELFQMKEVKARSSAQYRHVSDMLREMVATKTRLAYEKGQLQFQMEQMENTWIDTKNNSYPTPNPSLNVSSLTNSFMEAKDECLRIRSTLETVMLSHAELQHGVELLEAELGQKDLTIAQLTQVKEENAHIQETLSRRLEEMKQKLDCLSNQTDHTELIGSLQYQTRSFQEANTTLSSSLKTALSENSQLRQAVDALEERVTQQSALLDKVTSVTEAETRNHDIERRSLQTQLSELRIELDKLKLQQTTSENTYPTQKKYQQSTNTKQQREYVEDSSACSNYRQHSSQYKKTTEKKSEKNLLSSPIKNKTGPNSRSYRGSMDSLDGTGNKLTRSPIKKRDSRMDFCSSKPQAPLPRENSVESASKVENKYLDSMGVQYGKENKSMVDQSKMPSLTTKRDYRMEFQELFDCEDFSKFRSYDNEDGKRGSLQVKKLTTKMKFDKEPSHNLCNSQGDIHITEMSYPSESYHTKDFAKSSKDTAQTICRVEAITQKAQKALENTQHTMTRLSEYISQKDANPLVTEAPSPSMRSNHLYSNPMHSNKRSKPACQPQNSSTATTIKGYINCHSSECAVKTPMPVPRQYSQIHDDALKSSSFEQSLNRDHDSLEDSCKMNPNIPKDRLKDRVEALYETLKQKHNL